MEKLSRSFLLIVLGVDPTIIEANMIDGLDMLVDLLNKDRDVDKVRQNILEYKQLYEDENV